MKIFKSKWLSVVIILIVAWMGVSFVQVKKHQATVNREVSSMEFKIATLEKNNSALEKFVNYMSYPSFLQKEARLKLNYKADGEDVAFVYTDDSVKTGLSSNDFNKQLAQMPNVFKWWYYLLGY